MKISASVADKPGAFSPFIFVGDLIAGIEQAKATGYDRYLSMEIMRTPTPLDAATQALRHTRALLAGMP